MAALDETSAETVWERPIRSTVRKIGFIGAELVRSGRHAMF